MNPMAEQKVQGMMNAMSMRQDKELFQAKQKYEQMIAMNKDNPDEGLISNYKYHLNMIKSELGRRFPKKKNERMSNVAGNIPNPKSTQEKIAETSLDDLKQYLETTQQQIASDKLSNDQKKVQEATAAAIATEISLRDQKTEDQAKKDVAKTMNPSSSKKNVVLGITLGASVGALAGWKFGKNIWGFAFGGAALGTGIAVLVNKKTKSSLVPKTTTGK